MQSAMIYFNEPQEKSPIDDWLAANPSAVIRFVVHVAPYQILVLYE